MERRIKETYEKDSSANLKRATWDPYVKFFRWAIDRLEGRDGIVCFISNNSFTRKLAFDGMRKHLLEEFTFIYHLDLHGDIQDNPRISGTSHNVFGIKIGVGITLLVRTSRTDHSGLHYCRVPEELRRSEKLNLLEIALNHKSIQWKSISPDSRHAWLVPINDDQFQSLQPVSANRSIGINGRKPIFGLTFPGVNSGRDEVVYSFSKDHLRRRMDVFVDSYNAEVDRYVRAMTKSLVNDFTFSKSVKWSESLKSHLARKHSIVLCEDKVRVCLYRPFAKTYIYYDRVVIDRPGRFLKDSGLSNLDERTICVSGIASSKPFHALMTAVTTSYDLLEKTQCFPFYIYNPDGSNRRENITDWSLGEFRKQYKDESIEKWDIFYYIYGLLHHPGYRETFADNLKRDLPRIPFAPDFRAFERAGRELAKLHLEYEKLQPWELQWIETPGQKPSYRVEKMKIVPKYTPPSPPPASGGGI